jgi:carboxyl-terminal processing protease
LIAVMQEHSINRGKIDWNTFRTTVMAAGGAAQSVEQTFPAIRTSLELLGDGHSFYRPVTGTSITAARACVAPNAGTPTLPPTVGYVRVGSFSGSNAEANAFANAIQGAIAGADRDGLAGWIVDVRGNGGGNMWPMLAGVGPVLGTGRAGYFIDPLGAATAWEYRDGGAWLSGVLLQGVDTPYRLRRESPRVAVLIDGATGSSGEAIVIAFQRRPETRSFGTATCGRSTANQQYTMSDGALLFLAVAVMADRTRSPYGAQIVPDEQVADPQEAEQRAVAWLQTP